MIRDDVRVSHFYGPDEMEGGGDDDPKAQNEPVIATSPQITGLLLVGAKDESYGPPPAPWTALRNYRLGFMSSLNHGQVWKHDISADASANSVNLPQPTGCLSPFGWASDQQDPGVAVGGNGYLYLVGQVRRRPMGTGELQDTAVFFARQVETNPTPPIWEACNTIFGTCTGAGQHVTKPQVGADPSTDPLRRDRVYVAWDRFSGGSTWIEFAFSHDAGTGLLNQTSDPPQTLGTGDADVGSVVAPVLDVGPQGEVYVAWLREYSFPLPFDSEIDVARSTNGGQSFTILPPPQFSLDELRSGDVDHRTNYPLNSYPSVAVDRSPCCNRGRFYVAYADEGTVDPNEPAHADVRIAHFTPGTNPSPGTWLGPFTITASAPPETDQYFPDIAVDDYGRVGAIWLDRRDQVTPESGEYRVFFSYSNDGGHTWQPHRAVLDATEFSYPRGDWLPSPPQLDLGNRFGLAAKHDTFYVVWTDLRSWVSEVETEAGDIFSASIRLSVPDFDHDCDVDMSDFTSFQLCFGGSNNPPAPSCPPGVDADLDGDDDVDLADFLIFQQRFTASGVCWCPSGCAGSEGGEGAAGPQGGSSPESRPTGPAPPGEPSPEERYQMLYEYCTRNWIPFT